MCRDSPADATTVRICKRELEHVVAATVRMLIWPWTNNDLGRSEVTGKPKCFLMSVLKVAGASSVSDFVARFSPCRLQRPALSLYYWFCRVQRIMGMPGHCNCSSCFPPLCFTAAQKSTRFAWKTCHLKPSHVHNSTEALLSLQYRKIDISVTSLVKQ